MCIRDRNRLVDDLEITLVFPRTPGDAEPADVPPSIRVEHVPMRPGHLGKVLFEQRDFPAACRRVGATLAHVPYWGPPLRSPIPLVVTVHDLGFEHFPQAHPFVSRAYLRWSTRRHARRAAILVADSTATKEDLVRLHGVQPHRVRVVLLAVDDGLSPPTPDAIAQVRRLMGLAPDAPYLLHVGTLQPRKNLSRLLAAYATLSGDHPELRLVLVTNPVGAFLPASQAALERDWKRELHRQHGLVFNHLYTITNMPISRYLEWLEHSGNLHAYMDKLVQAFNPATVPGVMCRSTLSVGWLI